ncbi:MAG: 50S ribosomal protein L30 [candidate division Zixibacteria bacterium]|jgi:large subunit ribosomal protein L30|nr:50S ribosomal protein L30 [candidate division Zixibacteria bacterium]NIR67706.1 50S ribosomal protein L30 [candidate division Zixibacteria bacterium]NIS16772.1 50S ribosomal protein L30 [candidate division Zixibacteria bacterium]NIS48959.1 50S ribosomal protein L30 [candidate division Zixibacteria bacterium]NIT53175.1 50S ribosomal protein L30 [candidate division Zixibacteria bacterium]
MPAKLKVTQVRSLSGRIQKHRRTIEALGLKRMHHSVIHEDTPQIRGMIKAVSFMVKVEEV